MRPMRTTGRFMPDSSTRLICSNTLSCLAMRSDSHSAKLSAQSPPCSRKPSPRCAAASRSRRFSTSQDTTIGGSRALISGLLAESGAYQVQLGDVDETAAAGVARAHGLANIQAVRLDATD